MKVTGIDKASNAESDWDDDPDPLDDVKAYGLGFGGRRLCILRADDAANNFLYGGDGHNILLGGPMDDHLMTGRGGGVIRTGEGNNIVTTNGGNTRIFCGEGYSLVSVFVGRSTVICDPGGHTWIFGFDPAKGDRISFQGAFDGPEALRRAISVEPAEASLKGEENLIIALPGEGEVILQGCGPLADALADHVPDFTEGWYGRGWQEPPDGSP
ncbi:calcium-binding protein [Falsirhodobacter deserti]|uniref:calcium-binding protein n=1 Tax=Falsirhodobacter deserti TaxID=1365611 RepID=UPI000FE2A5BB|nr:calcium-binding protein [Falsirhodobacter deserti]